MPKNHRLLKRGNTFYYHRRVPPHLVEPLGKTVIKSSLRTASHARAVQLRSLKDVEWDEKFRSVEKQAAENQTLPLMTRLLGVERIRIYVEEQDAKWASTLTNDPPSSVAQRTEMIRETLEEIQTLREPDNPDALQWIWTAYQEITDSVASQFNDKDMSEQAFAEMIRRGLLEIDRRRLARLQDDFSAPSFDALFANEAQQSAVSGTLMTLGGLCDAYVVQYEKEAAYRGVDAKRIDKVRASVAVVREAMKEETIVASIDYQQCLAFREMLSKLPANVKKHYPKLSLTEAIKKASSDGRVPLSYVTQELHLRTLTLVLELGVKLQILSNVPSKGLLPWAPKTPDAEKRRPFTVVELAAIFNAPLYRGCKDDGRNFSKEGPNVIRHARFWVPLICLFSGMRANEVCQLEVADIKTTEMGCVYFDINNDGVTKKLKSPTSKRGVPVHPELVRMGFLNYVEQKRNAQNINLFPELKLGKYGYASQQLADWFTASFLPSVVTKDGKISLYSFRHNFRDALRAIEVPDWVLQKLGGWAQSKGVSDNYGSGYTPDQLQKYIEGVVYPGLDVSHLWAKNIIPSV